MVNEDGINTRKGVVRSWTLSSYTTEIWAVLEATYDVKGPGTITIYTGCQTNTRHSIQRNEAVSLHSRMLATPSMVAGTVWNLVETLRNTSRPGYIIFSGFLRIRMKMRPLSSSMKIWLLRSIQKLSTVTRIASRLLPPVNWPKANQSLDLVFVKSCVLTSWNDERGDSKNSEQHADAKKLAPYG